MLTAITSSKWGSYTGKPWSRFYLNRLEISNCSGKAKELLYRWSFPAGSLFSSRTHVIPYARERVLCSVKLLFRGDASIEKKDEGDKYASRFRNEPKPAIQSKEEKKHTYRVWEMNGKNRHELLITPKPDKRPRIIVPRTMSLDNAMVVISDEAKPAGKGICENAKR